MSRDQEAIFDCLESIRKIQAYTAGIDLADFVENDEKQDAVLRRLLVIGEAVKRLSPEFRSRYTAIAWREMAGMRDIIVHNYNRIELETVWDVIQVDLPILLEFLTSLESI